MTRKSKKGIVGKATPTFTQRPEVGVGLGFKEDNVKTGLEIEQAVKDRMK
ncbi:MAG: hypothetical protein K0R84_2208 [Clostridia bacterium]|jgi:hypothetical protein|nr:hypothetical protein [Clostridia bacterium]